MILSEHNLYGWGASNIAMPRATFGLHPDRLSRTGEIAYHNIRGSAACQWRSSSISRIFLDDCPWHQVLLLGIFSTLIIIYIYVLNITLPIDRSEPLPRPVEIVVAIQQDELQETTIPVEQEPLASLAPEHVKQDVMVEPVTEEPQKKVIERPKAVKPDVPEKMQRTAPAPHLPPVEIKQPIVPKKPPELESPASVAPIIASHASTEKITISPPTVRKRNYTEKDINRNSQPSQAGKAADLKSTKIEIPTSLKDKLAGQRYVSKANTLLAEAQTAPPSTNQLVSFQPQRRKKIAGLEHSKLDSRSTDQSSSAPGLSKKTGETIQSAERELSFQFQKLKETPKLAPPVSNKLIAKATRSPTKGSSALAKAHNFYETVASEGIDPSELISLQAFNVCIDPEKEFRQKTELAARLDRPTRTEAGGVVFFIKYPESGYTIEIGIYNPQGRLFKDRCEVLELAINSIANRVN